MLKKIIFNIVMLVVTLLTTNSLAAIKVYPNPDTRSISLSVPQGETETERTFQLVVLDDENANFAWQIVPDPGATWMVINSISGRGASTYRIPVTLNAAHMPAGNYSGTFLLIINLDNNTTITIDYTVNLTVFAIAAIKVYPNPDTRSISLSVAQGQATRFQLVLDSDTNTNFAWQIVPDPGATWMGFNPISSDMVGVASTYSIQVILDATNMLAGNYSGKFYIINSDDNTTIDYTVNLTVTVFDFGVSMVPSGSVTLEAAPGQQRGLDVVLTSWPLPDQPQGPPFNWGATSDASWLTAVPNTGRNDSIYSVRVIADATDLMARNEPYIGTISFVTDLGTTHQLTVLFYVNHANIDAQPVTTLTLNTSSWLNLVQTLNPVNMSGRLFVLMEHPQLVPYKTYAYRVTANGPRLDLFSQWGRPVTDAINLAYANDVKTVTRIVLGGFRMAGLEGNLIVRLMVGNDVNNLTEIKRWDITIQPLTGEWDLQELFYGNWWHYSDLLVISDRGGLLSAVWGSLPVSLNYGNAITSNGSLSICSDGVSFCSSSGALQGNADYQFTVVRNTIYGPMEFMYHITQLEASVMRGTWQYRLLGTQTWSLPERFEARTHGGLVIPYDDQRQAYFVNGTVRGLNGTEYPIRFQVDTGADTVLLDNHIAQYLGINIANANDRTYQAASCHPSEVSGVGGTITTTTCRVRNITLDGKLSRSDVWVSFGDWPRPALLGMSFLEGLSVSTNPSDRSMTISY